MNGSKTGKQWRIVDRTPVLLADSESGGDATLSFSLIYEGELLSSNCSDRQAVRENKHAIRRQLHTQLKEFWKQDYTLQYMARSFEGTLPAGTGWTKDIGLKQIAAKYARCGFEFIPLVRADYRLTCALDVLFLRRESPGSIVQGGDIDNRIKTLFDGLRLPQNCDEITANLEQDEKPFYCLLEDDRLITEVKIRTERLLRPTSDAATKHAEHHVVLIIGVELKQTSKLW